LDGRAQQWALEKGKKAGDTIGLATDLTPYIKLNSSSSIPPCPAAAVTLWPLSVSFRKWLQLEGAGYPRPCYAIINSGLIQRLEAKASGLFFIAFSLNGEYSGIPARF